MNMTKQFLSVFVSLCLVCLLCLGGVTAAFADEVETNEGANTVNQSQLPDSSFLYDVPISELYAADKTHDQQVVQIAGEVVGDLIADEANSNYGWVTIQEMSADNPSVVNVYVLRSETEQIDAWGHYGQQGSSVQVRGEFHLVCAEHQGQTDIHAETMSVTAKGQPITYEASSMVTTLAWLFPLVGAGLYVYYRHRREQER